MKKIIFSFFALPFIALCFCVTLHAQSSENDLDQAELMKQFIGKWTSERGEDTTLIWEAIPINKGYEVNVFWQAKGETYLTTKGILGFARNKKLLNWYHLWPGGAVARDVGKFVSDNKLIMERHAIEPKHVMCKFETKFINSDKYVMTWKCRGMKDTWDGVEPVEYVWTRVKE
jgi:hypothetical protein